MSVSPAARVAVDGSIYNAPDLGERGDAAVVVSALYERHGFPAALARLNGDFAIALHDARSDTLWLAVDRFGVKPLHYVVDAERIVFASRPRSALVLADRVPAIDTRWVALFAGGHYRYIDNDPVATPYAGVRRVRAGHVLRADARGITEIPYWRLTDAPDWEEDEAALAARYRDLLIDAVERRTPPGGRTAFTLSGGMDSSSVLACAARAAHAPREALSVVYDDQTYDESSEIQPMLESLVSPWHAVKIGTPDVLGIVEALVEVHEEPVVTATWLSHYVLCQAARERGISVLFGGLGGDELNAGEYEYFPYFFADLRAAGRDVELADEVERWAAYHDHPLYPKSRATMEAALARVTDPSRPGRCRPDRERMLRYRAAVQPEIFDLARFEPVMEHPFRSWLKNRAFQDMSRETLPCSLRAQESNAAATGIETRLPFLDHRLVELMFRVPGTLKIRAGVTKHLLREAMRGLVPEATRTRVKKTGWNAPAHIWFSGSGRDGLLDIVHSRAFAERGLWNVAEVHRLVEEHETIVSSGRLQENHMMFLWQLVNLELWWRTVGRVSNAVRR